MKRVFVLATLALVTFFTASAASYKLDNSEVDALFDNAVETVVSYADVMSLASTSANSQEMMSSNTSTVAISCVVSLFVGGFGIHRYVLGTKSSMWAIYTFTVCGIFGIVPTIDFWVLLIDGLIMENGDKYMDNESFFMWVN